MTVWPQRQFLYLDAAFCAEDVSVAGILSCSLQQFEVWLFRPSHFISLGLPRGADRTVEVHLFGHIHEQRGHWHKAEFAACDPNEASISSQVGGKSIHSYLKAGSQFQGGVEYRPNPQLGRC